MSKLYYMALEGVGSWDRALKDVSYLDLDHCTSVTVAGVPDVIPGLLYANLIFARPETLAKFEHRLPEDVDSLIAAAADLPAFRRAWSHARADVPEPLNDWSAEYAWRLIRSYELRGNAPERKSLDDQLSALMPVTLNQEHKEQLARVADSIRRVALPSILELLQTGFEKLPTWGQSVALNDGLPAPALAQRLVSLSYQHRMHPDISAFSREQFYTTPEQPTRSLLRDASGLARSWDYGRFARRAIWIEVQRQDRSRQTQNPAEADIILRELEAFVEWAQLHPKREEPWSVALLTFYRGQEKLLRERLQVLGGQPGNTRNFDFPREQPRVHVSLCTVDRFQGHEADIVFLSFVRGGTNKRGTVGFLNSPNRLNVALTRARYQIVLVGDRGYFERCRSALLSRLATSPHYATELAWSNA